jgi:hypothetical protein
MTLSRIIFWGVSLRQGVREPIQILIGLKSWG